MQRIENTTVRDILGHRESRQIVKYAIVGVTNVAIDFVLYAVLVDAGLGYVLAKVLSLAVATANGYTFNRLWTFRAGRHRHSMAARYYAVQCFCLALNLVLLALLIEVADVGEVPAQAIALPFVAGVSFLINRFWTFGRR